MQVSSLSQRCSLNEKITDIYGNVWYQENRDWESELMELIKKI